MVAKVNMDSDPDTLWETYNFNYDAKVKDGVIETKDAAGWSNRTGKMRIDFEHDSLMSGDEINITNILSDSAPFPVEAGGKEDWLSCCIGGTSDPYYPEIETWTGCEDGHCVREGDWPNSGTWNTLAPAKLLPNVNRTQKCTIDPDGKLRCADPTYRYLPCSDTNCSGFECVYQFDGDRRKKAEEEEKEPSAFAKASAMQVDQFYYTTITGENKTEVTYNITITNSGTTKLTNVTLIDTLPAGMNYTDSSYGTEGKPKRLNVDDVNNTVVLSIGNLTGSKLVQLVAMHDSRANPHDYYASNKVEVRGEAPDGSIVNKTADPAKKVKEPITEPEGVASFASARRGGG